MLNTEIIYTAFKDASVENVEKVKDETCMICGKNIEEGVKFKKVLSGSFTNHDLLKNRKGTYICKECSFCIKEDSLRKNSFIADKGNLYLLKKNDLENYLFDLDKFVKDEFVIGVTQSFKKHNAFRCRVNHSIKEFYIRLEDIEFIFNVDKLSPLYSKLNEAYLQFSKDEILYGNYKLIGIDQFGLDKFEEYENEFKRHRGSVYFSFLIYIMNSERRNEIIKERSKK